MFIPALLSRSGAALLAFSFLLVATAPAQMRVRGGKIAPQPAVIQQSRWVTTWAMAPSTASNNPLVAMGATPPFTNQTIRLMNFVSVGGDQVRVRISNVYGTQALNIGAARVALRASTSTADIVASTDRTLTFGGQTSISIPSGAVALSDPVSLTVPALSDLAVSIYLPDAGVPSQTIQPSTHKNSYVALAGTGDVTASATFPTVGTVAYGASYFLTGIEVLAANTPPAVMALGDSITEGVGSTTDANASWPNRLAVRLNGQNSFPAAVGNVGISGGRILRDVDGPNGLSRFDRDVLARPNLTHAINLVGINDIGFAGFMDSPTNQPTAADLIQAYRQLIARAHDRGVKMIGGTILPFKNALTGQGVSPYYSEAKEAVRQGVNAWMRNSAEFDGIIDFDSIMGAPGDPLTLNPAYSSGDGLHPNDAGYQAMANFVDPTLLNSFVTLNSVVSRKTHGSLGGTAYDLALPQAFGTTPAIESRSGGANGDYTLVFSFAAPVTAILGTAVAEGTGSVSSYALDPNDSTKVIVNVTGINSGQYITVGLTNVSDGVNTSSVRATMGVLVGDTNGDGTVDSSDIAQTTSRSGQALGAANFRSDLNADGSLNSSDIAFVQSRSGTGLPAAPIITP